MHVLNQSNFNEFLSTEIESSCVNPDSNFLNNGAKITLIQMNDSIFEEQESVRKEDNEKDDDWRESEEDTTITLNNDFFQIYITPEAKFQINPDDWIKLKSLQLGHKFHRGEWEDYFVAGMKQSNKYCVFAFKDHYVNQASLRKRKSTMENTGKISTNSNAGEKIFSAKGYCVFDDCSIKFCLRMNAERVVHVTWSGELKHSLNQIKARYFRGKSRDDLREILKHSKPKREFLDRVESHAKIGVTRFGNADYVGKSFSVYRRIAAEAKDYYKSLLVLQNEFVENEENRSNFNLVRGKFFREKFSILCQFLFRVVP